MRNLVRCVRTRRTAAAAAIAGAAIAAIAAPVPAQGPPAPAGHDWYQTERWAGPGWYQTLGSIDGSVNFLHAGPFADEDACTQSMPTGPTETYMDYLCWYFSEPPPE